ncbi:DUF4158 domain-containing protein (plasmid) [Kitasatospora sp. NBC_00070]|uniref:DUF4158 domain-containing protein n=1 Tax=Kitasatospora sp. NBC_00070 TaxID=2975962 RepID=UPI00324FD775
MVDFVRKAVELLEGTVPGQYASVRMAEAHCDLLRARGEGTRFDAGQARRAAREVIRVEARSKNNPADLINVALEQLVRSGLELPGFSTLDRRAMSIRTQVHGDIFDRVAGRIGEEERAHPLRLLTVVGLNRKTVFNQLKQSAQQATWSNMKKAGRAPQVAGLAGRHRGCGWRAWRPGRSRTSPAKPRRGLGRAPGLRGDQAGHADRVPGPQGPDAGPRRPDDDVHQAGGDQGEAAPRRRREPGPGR